MTKACMRVERVLLAACPLIMFVVGFAHMTALENIALGWLGVGTLAAACSLARPPAYRWPLVLPIFCWGAWSLASVSWSALPHESMHAWLDEVLYPLVSFLGFWLVGTQLERPQRIVAVHWVACVLVAVTSIIYWGKLQPPTADTFLLHYYNRVGHTSTIAVFAMPLFTGLMIERRWRWMGVSGVLLALFIGLATLNRFFWPAACVTLAIALFPLYRRHMVLAAVTLAIIGAAAIGTLELSSRMRYAHAPPPNTPHAITIDGEHIPMPSFLTGIRDSMSADTRPRLWAFYGHAGEPHAWTGVGFGKSLPGQAYKSQIPPSLLAAEPQALTHAHNLFMNTWLETGIIGVVLELALLGALVVRFWRVRHAVPWVSAAGIALVGGMVAKNFTDDFMWQTTALAFWCFAGLLLGRGERLAGRVPPPKPRAGP
ncbi:O-antigen ligase family protein [Caballeronia humi]|uniref:Membrane protein n=1 Tax=Caballeronia humi TaxID=326474 RepID=A0A158FL45_9BURK|nr:O-antigen ligase family protein [Caballeronia humi]SAL20059.1 membrane protein [Caballeronia humi]